MSDGIPSDVTSCFFHHYDWAKMPIDTVHLDPVAGCNYRCPHCIERGPKNRNTRLSIDACIRVLCDIKKAGCRRLGLYGGEPTLHPQFPTLFRAADTLGFETLLVTNGSRLNRDDICKALSDAKASTHVRVSMDANSPASYASVHGLHEHSDPKFEEVVQGVTRVIETGVPVTISVLVRDLVVNELHEATVQWKERGARALILRPITECGGRSPNLALSPDAKERLRSLLTNHATFVLTPEWFSTWLDKDQQPALEKPYKTCYSALYRMAVSPPPGNREGQPLQETDALWISLCTYARDCREKGLPYPADFGRWASSERVKAVEERLCPAEDCNDIICCRDGYNRIIQDIVKA